MIYFQTDQTEVAIQSFRESVYSFPSNWSLQNLSRDFGQVKKKYAKLDIRNFDVTDSNDVEIKEMCQLKISTGLQLCEIKMSVDL
jgi:hypothetical protein